MTTRFTPAFTKAFNHAMLWEVGGFWNPNDPEVIAGLCATREQRRKVGYVNIPADRGGETKFGVAQNANPHINVWTLDLAGAMSVYYNEYWLKGYCDKMTSALSIIHFDGCINHGTGRANKFLQQAAGVTQDGIIGRITMATVAKIGEPEMIKRISKIRSDFYNAIVARNPSQHIFLKGWTNRIADVTQYASSNITVV